MFGGWGMGGWTTAFIGLMCLAVWGLLIVAVVALLGVSRRARLKGLSQVPSASELLAQRYARGEIDEEELRRRLAVVEQSTTMSSDSGR